MPRPARPWFRFYVEAFSDRKILRISPAQRWIWVAILGAARESAQPGTLLIADGIAMTAQEIARYADVGEREVTKLLPILAKLGMTCGDATDDNPLRVLNWNSRQFESDDVTKRTQAHRERSKEQGWNVRRNAPETETETEQKKSIAQSASADGATDAQFEAFWDAYDKKRDRKRTEQKWRAALKKPGITPELLIEAAAAYIASQRTKGKHPEFTKNPDTWLNGENWNDESGQSAKPDLRVANQPVAQPPDGLTDEQMWEWHAEQRRRRA